MGWLFDEFNQNAANIAVSGWIQSSYATSNRGDQLIPALFFRREEGFSLDQAGLFIERKPNSNVDARVGPFPGPKPDEFDWGFNLTVSYGADNFFFRTYGWDDNLGTNAPGDLGNTDYYATLTQAFVDLYFPVLGGSNLKIGLFHTPLENEIGFALPAPAPASFYSHPYTFMHGPAKHAGMLWSSKLNSGAGDAMWAYELGLVRGWNNVQDPNEDFDVIANLRWRSADFRTWVDFESIYGNGADDAFGDCPCGSGIVADSVVAGDDNLPRFAAYLTLSHQVSANNQLVLEINYGVQENALFPDLFNDESPGIPEQGGEDGRWYGANLSWLHAMTSTLSWNTRWEFFDTDGVHVILPFAGRYTTVTTNLTWYPADFIRVRPELRYNHYSGEATPFGADLPPSTVPPLIFGEFRSQMSYALDVTVFY